MTNDEQISQEIGHDDAENQEENINRAFKIIGKKFGSESVRIGNAIVKVDVIPTGVASLDLALGVGGIPRGRIIEIYGGESSGKTTLCLRTIASCQDAGLTAAIIDAEHAIDPLWATAQGVDMNKLILSQPSSGEEALAIIDTLIDCSAAHLIVIDSVAALTPQCEIDGEITDANIGAQARMISKAMRRFTGKCAKKNVTLMFINQLRDKIGVMYGDPSTTPGGRALKFYASVRMEIRKSTTIALEKQKNQPKEDAQEKHIGHLSTVKVVKSKVSQPFKTASFSIYFRQSGPIPSGIDRVGSILDAGVVLGAITVNGGNYYINGERLGNGKNNVVNLLYSDKDKFNLVNNKVYDVMKSNAVVLENEDGEE